MQSQNILVTTDFSTVSFAALTYAAKMQVNQITLLSIVQSGDVPPDLLKQMPNPNAVQEYRADVLKQTKAKLDSIAAQYFTGKQVQTDVIVCNEDVASEICKYANSYPIDIIVMTGQGRGALGNLFVGSTVQKVLRMTKHPVLVIPKEE
ncbi:universal stress protein [Nitrosomonas aestuarii]|uniref:universal stress protein n=1 Tax=Nitrosomonas aestuarii TaxID=52441 RepID=UPI000D303428|nr:universal stress protein [Nitrosomonas aestuarii]PTN13252.1 nucleotide-binding universal stress UspA family protein [Nitrosomonas aestuarii]